MSQPKRMEKRSKVKESLNTKTTYIQVDNREFKRPGKITLERLGNILNIKIDEDLSEMNVTSLEITFQGKDPSLLPDTLAVSPKTQIAVDENYLYVWVSKVSRWKRILLSEWSLEELE